MARNYMTSGEIGSTNKEELNKILEERRKQRMADPQAAMQLVNSDVAAQNLIANEQRVQVMNNPKIPLEQRVAAKNEYMNANPDTTQQPSTSSNQVVGGLQGASQVAGAAGGGAVQSGLMGAAAGAGIGASVVAGAKAGGMTGPQGALIGAGIGAGVATTGAIMQQRAAKKARKRDAAAEHQTNLAVIEQQTEEKRQNAYKGMMDSLRSAFIWS